MIQRIRSRLIILVFCSIATGCVSLPRETTEREEPKVVVEKTTEIAALERRLDNQTATFSSKQDLASASTTLALLLLLDPGNQEYRLKLRQTTVIIEEQVKRHTWAAKSALRRGDYRSARLAYLKILALQPENQEAISALIAMQINQRSTEFPATVNRRDEAR